MKSAMSLYAKDGHKRVARMLGYALTLGTADAWLDASTVFAVRLSEQERTGLAFAALTALGAESRLVVAEATLARAGEPQAAFLSETDQAAFWADMASQEELEAYCLASYLAMPEARQAAFLRYASGRAAA